MEHYGSVQDFISYMQAKGYDYPEVSPSEEMDQALIRGSMYIDNTYRDRFPGTKTGGRSQRLAWPRKDAFDAEGEPIPSDEIPWEVEYAAYEASWRELTDPGSLTPDYTASERVKSEQIGSIATTYAISDAAFGPDNQPTIPDIEGLLSGLLGSPASVYFGTATRI
jgi:hypothetical protein